MKPSLVFWYEFSSTYSYLSAMRIGASAARAGVAVEWRPFLLGPIFKAQGWDTSPFNLFPAKGRYMVRDIGRMSSARGLEFKLPVVFPFSTVKAARMAWAAENMDARARFSRLVFDAAFERNLDVSDDAVLRDCLERASLDASENIERSQSHGKSALREATDAAQALGIFGAPSFTTVDGELFWGDDRLDQALEWAANLKTSIVAQ